MRLLIVSGTSGSGKSIALHALEDLGFYSIDNLPLALLPAFAEELRRGDEAEYQNAAVGIDARNLTHDLSPFPQMLQLLRSKEFDCELLYIDASDRVLIKRFSETRRRHPLSGGGLPLEEAILHERQLLKPLAAEANVRLDTSKTNVHQLRDLVQEHVGRGSSKQMSLLFESFGFKHGLPVDADYVFDVRCLPNPHWEGRLRTKTGRDPEVIHFLENHFEVNGMYEEIRDFLEKWLPRFQADKRSYLTVAIGCTGGQHRSVYLVNALAKAVKNKHNNILARHREIS